MSKVHVLLKKEELDHERLNDKVVIVLDVLFATSTIITALQHGAADVVPVEDEAAARRAADQLQHGSYLLAGELYAETIPGFASPTPLALLNETLANRRLIYSTTNGTVALKKSERAEHVYAAALLNGAAVIERVAREHAGRTVLIVCSGSVDMFNLEDFLGAGYLVNLLCERVPGAYDMTDAALAARTLFAPDRVLELLMSSRVGRMMQERNLTHEVHFAAKLSTYDVVPKLSAGRLHSIAHSTPSRAAPA